MFRAPCPESTGGAGLSDPRGRGRGPRQLPLVSGQTLTVSSPCFPADTCPNDTLIIGGLEDEHTRSGRFKPSTVQPHSPYSGGSFWPLISHPADTPAVEGPWSRRPPVVGRVQLASSLLAWPSFPTAGCAVDVPESAATWGLAHGLSSECPGPLAPRGFPFLF